MPSVKAQVTDSGDLELGAEIDGTFVPAVIVPAFRVEQMLEARKAGEDSKDDKGKRGGK